MTLEPNPGDGTNPRPETAKVETSREDLHQIYESAVVELSYLTQRDDEVQSDDEWFDASTKIRERGMGGVVITGWNPGQYRPTAQENEMANERLLSVLRSTGLEIWRADGFSPDRTFREPGFMAWGMGIDQGCAIARDFGQFAIFYYEQDGDRAVISSGLE